MKLPVETKSSKIKIPRISQIKQAIRGKIQSGSLKAGDKLPSLSQMAQMFECSLGLVRQAINTLTAEGLLTSQPRKGVFVADFSPAISDIILITPTAHMENLQRIFEGVRIGLEQSPYRMVLHAANFDYDQQMAMVHELDPQSVAGVLVLPPPFIEQAKPLVRLSQQGIPIVQVGRSVQGVALDAVVADGVEMGQMAMAHLLSHGHQRIGYICNQTDYHFNSEILEGFALSLKTHGMTIENVAIAKVSATDLNSERPWQNGQKAAWHLLQQNLDLTAIIGMNPHITLGAYKAVGQVNKKIGDDISLLGLFSDLSFFSALEPTVSVVCCDLNQIGQRAAGLLRQRIENPNTPNRSLCLSASLISRQSVQQCHKI